MLESEQTDTENEMLYDGATSQIFGLGVEEDSEEDENTFDIINSQLIINDDKKIFKSLNEKPKMEEVHIGFSESENDFQYEEQMTLNKQRYGKRKIMKKKTEQRYINSDKKRISDIASSYCGGFAFFSIKVILGCVDIFQGFRFDRPYCSFPLTKYERQFYEINGLNGESEENNSNLLRMNGLMKNDNNFEIKKDMFELGTDFNSDDEKLFNEIKNITKGGANEDVVKKNKEIEEKEKELEREWKLLEEERKKIDEERKLFNNTKKVKDLTSESDIDSDYGSEIENETLITLENTPSKLSNNETENENEETIEDRSDSQYTDSESNSDSKIETQNETPKVDFFNLPSNTPSNIPPPDSDNGNMVEEKVEKPQKTIQLGGFFLPNVIDIPKKSENNRKSQMVLNDNDQDYGDIIMNQNKHSFSVKCEERIMNDRKSMGMIETSIKSHEQMQAAISKLHKKKEIIENSNIFETEHFMQLETLNLLLHSQMGPLIEFYQKYKRKNIDLPHIKEVIFHLDVLKKDVVHLIQKYKETRKTIESEKNSASGRIMSLYVVCSSSMGNYIKELETQMNTSREKRNNTKSNSDDTKTKMTRKDVENISSSSSAIQSDDSMSRISRKGSTYIGSRRRKNVFDKYIDQFKEKSKKKTICLPSAPKRPDVYLKEINVG
jgi:hypothetical protein